MEEPVGSVLDSDEESDQVALRVPEEVSLVDKLALGDDDCVIVAVPVTVGGGVMVVVVVKDCERREMEKVRLTLCDEETLLVIEEVIESELLRETVGVGVGGGVMVWVTETDEVGSDREVESVIEVLELKVADCETLSEMEGLVVSVKERVVVGVTVGAGVMVDVVVKDMVRGDNEEVGVALDELLRLNVRVSVAVAGEVLKEAVALVVPVTVGVGTGVMVCVTVIDAVGSDLEKESLDDPLTERLGERLELGDSETLTLSVAVKVLVGVSVGGGVIVSVEVKESDRGDTEELTVRVGERLELSDTVFVAVAGERLGELVRLTVAVVV